MTQYQEVVDAILIDINSVSTTDDADVLAAAQELAEGVTAEREAEICDALPVPYTFLAPARAQLDDEKIRVPRAVNTAASWTPENGWNTGSVGRRLRQKKADCAVGVHVDLDLGGVVTILRIVVLWKRVK